MGSSLVPGEVGVRAGSEDAASQHPTAAGIAQCSGCSRQPPTAGGTAGGTAGCQGQQCWAATPHSPRRSAPPAPRSLGSTAIEIGIIHQICKSVFGVGSENLKHHLFHRNTAMVNKNRNNYFLRRH